MNRTVFLLFLFNLINATPNSTHLCGSTRSVTCKTEDYCFTNLYFHPEGTIENLDCFRNNVSNKLLKSACKRLDILGKSRTSCVTADNEIICCCHRSTGNFCNQRFLPNEQIFKGFTQIEWIYLLTTIVVVTVMFFILINSFDTLNAFQPQLTIEKSNTKFIQVIYIIKVLLCLINLVCLWVPFKWNCMKHEKGEFRKKWWFNYHLFQASALTSIFVVTPLFFAGFEMNLIIKFRKNYSYNKIAQIIVSLIFSLLPLGIIIEPLLIYIKIYQRERTPGYCRVGYQMWLLMSSFVIYITYAIMNIIAMIQFWRNSVEKEDDSSENDKDDESSSETLTLSTAKSHFSYDPNEPENLLLVTPRPFHVTFGGTSVIRVNNTSPTLWIALRAILSTTGFYSIHPTRFMIPPQRHASIEIQQVCKHNVLPAQQHNVLIEWFLIGSEVPSISLQRLWSQPYIVPQTQWNFFVLPVYLDTPSSISNCSLL